MDDESSRYLSFDADHFLGGTRSVGIGTTAISPGEYFAARSFRDIALARFAAFARAECVARCCALGPPSGAGRIGGLDNRDEEHGIWFVLPAVDPLLCQVAKGKRARRNKRRWLELC